MTSDFAATERPRKPSAKTRRTSRRVSLSLALPSTILVNAQKQDQRTALVGSIARYAVIFRLDEIVVYDDGLGGETPGTATATTSFDHLAMFSRLLRYLDCPQYLRKRLFPLHNDLKLAGTLPPLDSPAHGRPGVWGAYRQGVVLEQGEVRALGARMATHGQPEVFLDVGLSEPVVVHKALPVGARLTVRMPENGDAGDGESGRRGLIETEVVPDSEPGSKGLYWGYKTRVARSLAKVFTERHEGEYDLVIGTSERGEDIQEVTFDRLATSRHVLLVFGGLSGLELAIEKDPEISLQAHEAGKLFDYWVNICPGQASRTIRTEEAIPITLAKLEAVLG